MRIGELARRTGISVRMLRYYEQEGLLRPARETSGYRQYADDDVRLVERIRLLGEAGLTLASIRIVLPCTDADGLRFQPCAAVRPALQREMQRISEKIDALQSSRRMLQDYLADTAPPTA
ncbi:MAG: HTH-type transcriptional regulator HmrR [Stenotrophomonas maltophilia]|nr:MAG: HTH-type transcriptional regulator HmrR [Stenotrophomonas maltophilia]